MKCNNQDTAISKKEAKHVKLPICNTKRYTLMFILENTHLIYNKLLNIHTQLNKHTRLYSTLIHFINVHKVKLTQPDVKHTYHTDIQYWQSLTIYKDVRIKIIYIYILFVCFSVRLLSVLHGHSDCSSPPQRPMTSDFEGFSIPDFIHYIYFPILILEKSQSLLNDQC